MEKLTEKEIQLLKEFLAIELEKGGNKYTNVLLKLEKNLIEGRAKNITEVEFFSVWDGGHTVESKAKFNKETNEVFDIEVAEIDNETLENLEVLDKQFILFNKKELEVSESNNGYHVITI